MNGKLIVIEGLDGTGKSTQAALLHERLNNTGRASVLSAEPTGGEIGKLIRRAISGKEAFSPAALAALFLADRIDHNTNPENGLQTVLAEGVCVISARYYYSSMAYQGKDTDFDWVMRQNLDCPYIRTPDLCVFLDMDPEKCMERICSTRDCAALDVFENLADLTQIREAFHRVLERLKSTQNIVVIDADAPIEEISDKIFKEALALF
ncbi:MAG: dTMP kinase [Oscillospiraceae bacterium]|jgi:dTMP kinase|nr:dTMP kinase [Oscillospiraceae bacterium]